MSINQMRRTYQHSGLSEQDVHADPFEQFRKWFDEAKSDEVPSWLEINAMTLSTVSADHKVSSRIVLLKAIEAGEFRFFTNYRSAKAKQMEENSHVSLCILWPHVERQVRICGTVAKTDRETSIEYFRSRPRGSQLGAWVSEQSAAVASRASLESSLHELESLYFGRDIPCPEHWGGYAVTPDEIEFWQGRDNRLHDRILYKRSAGAWSTSRLAP